MVSSETQDDISFIIDYIHTLHDKVERTVLKQGQAESIITCISSLKSFLLNTNPKLITKDILYHLSELLLNIQQLFEPEKDPESPDVYTTSKIDPSNIDPSDDLKIDTTKLSNIDASYSSESEFEDDY